MKNNMNYPLISVITVSYNAVLTIEQTILSVINQTYLNIEYIIIDGGSTDGTVNVIKKYADKIAYWVSESDKGIYDAMNKGIAYSHGEYCNFINAGDKFCSSSILKQVMDFNHVADIIVVHDLHVNEHNKIVSRSVLPRRYNLLHFYITTIPHQSCFIRASLLKKYYYDTSLKIVSDWKMWLIWILQNRTWNRCIFILRYPGFIQIRYVLLNRVQCVLLFTVIVNSKILYFQKKSCIITSCIS